MDLSTVLTTAIPNSTVSPRLVSNNYYPLQLRAILGTIAVLAILTNGSLCYVILRNRTMLRTAHNVLVFTLAITDTLTGIFTILSPRMVLGFDSFYATQGIAGDLYCRFIYSNINIWVFAKFSIGLVSCMTMERWYAVIRPHQYKFAFKRSRVIVFIVLLAAGSILIHITGYVQKIIPEMGCVSVPLIPDALGFRLRAVVLVTVTFLIPLVVITSITIYIKHAMRKGKAALSATTHALQTRLVHVTSIVALVLFVSFLPNQVYYLFIAFGLASSRSPWYLLTMVMCSLNSTLNPFIYFSTNREYRSKIPQFTWPCKKNQVVPRENTTQTNTETIQTDS